jgi:hypothetical protein
MAAVCMVGTLNSNSLLSMASTLLEGFRSIRNVGAVRVFGLTFYDMEVLSWVNVWCIVDSQGTGKSL